MIVTTYKGIKVPNAIRTLLNDTDLAMFFLTGKEFRRLCRYHRFYNNPTAFITMGDYYIFVNGQRILQHKYSQAEINYLFLHEIAHGILDILGERNDEIDADREAKRLAKDLNIKVDSQGVQL